jgi:thiol-disulfide isomerase/thioredoxin
VNKPPRPLRSGAAAAALSSLLVILVGCSAPASSTGSKGYISGTGAITVFDAADRQPVPELHGSDLDGKPLTVGAVDELTVVNIWAAWCGPCRAEADDLVVASHRLPDVQFYGVDIRDVRSAAQAFVRNAGIRYPSLFDPSGQSLLALHDIVTVSSPPTTLVLDSSGRLAAVVSGELTARTLVGVVDDVSRGA